MDSKSGLGPAGDREMCAFKLGCLPCFFGFLRSFWRIFNHPRVECALMHDTCVLKFLRSEVHKRCEILSHTSVFKFKFSPQNLIVPKF